MNVHAPAGPSYSLTASPTSLDELEDTTLTFSITGGTASTAYTFQITVTKPGSAGQAHNSLSLTTDASGAGVGAIVYYNYTPQWTATSGTAQTDISGNYTVSIVETAPKSVTTGFPTATFRVTSALTVSIISPTQGTAIQRGTSASFLATVADVNGLPVGNAQVSVSMPAGGQLSLSPTTPTGTYSGSYRVQRNDPLGSWNITASAYSPSPSTTNNFGANSILVTVSPSQLIISSLSTYNEYGTPTADFSPGDTVYASFSVSYPTGGYLTNGSFTVRVQDPSGTTTTTLASIYDPNRNLFYTPSGLSVSTSDPAGSWNLVFPAQSISDAYGNSGPTVSVTGRFVIHQPQDQAVISPFYFVIAALAIGGGVGTTIFLKRFNYTTGSFDDLFKLTGGEMQPATTLMIASDSGAGSTTMGLELLSRELAKGKFCGLLSYDAFPSEIGRRMRDMGWDITEYLKTGQLNIIDCYSALAGVEGSAIRDPTDFTEVSIQVSGMIEKTKGPVTILLDSVTPIFNSAAAKDCINFLQVVGAKIKNSGGIFIFTSTKASIPEEVRSKIEALADGVIELNLVKKAGSLRRTLQVKKMAGHQASPVETGFEIVQGKGIVIRRQRIRLGLFWS
ncbi:MAG TPA: ATPase domain-containing protein [Candidatus Dormibacteraeota bacterium]|jgi:KaiC/GvpD/RAD55 family RecA-like ATPase|nr:ATPase domain-containing protein [Candidatus Dormibacteraeota bacterium]